MPRKSTPKSIEAHIGSIIDSAASAIATAVRQEMTSELQRLLASRAGSGRAIAVHVPSVKVAVGKAPGKATAKVTTKTGKPRGGAGQKRNVPKQCIYPNCTNPSKGPRWSFLCDKHKDAPKAERTKLLAQWKSQSGGAAASPAPKKATKPGPKKGAGQK
ncbi:MAG TPA: hypothetical protein VIA18_07935, partial [Polyangia bacterium]|nr:hypothetical protein [Polyangia bacterium]